MLLRTFLIRTDEHHMKTLTTIALLGVLLASQLSRAGAQTPIEGTLPADGIGLVVSTGSSIEALLDGAESEQCRVRSVWVSSEGRLVGFIPGTPSFVQSS